MADPMKQLRVLVVDGITEQHREVTSTVRSLGHEVVGEGAELATVAQVTVTELPDVALVVVGEHSDQSLELIRTIEHVRSSIDISLERFAEYHALEGAFGRRAITERAKGILMERHTLDEQEAFRLLREQARRTNRKIVDVAASVLESHRLLPSGRERTSLEEGSSPPPGDRD